jgi:uncharacterized protein (DUF427 family)
LLTDFQGEKMVKALWNDVVIAESNQCEIVENNFYFPPDAIHTKHFRPSDHHTVCPWKGRANYYHIEVNGKMNENAAWYYPDPQPAAKHIKNYVAFWKGVEIKE